MQKQLYFTSLIDAGIWYVVETPLLDSKLILVQTECLGEFELVKLSEIALVVIFWNMVGVSLLVFVVVEFGCTTSLSVAPV